MSISAPFLSSPGRGRKLNVALLLDKDSVPRYGSAIIRDLINADFVRVVGCARLSTNGAKRTAQDSLAFRLFCGYVEWRHRVAADPFEPVDYQELLAASEIECVSVHAGDCPSHVNGDLSEQLKIWDPDVAIDLSSAAPRGALCSIPHHGFWRFHFGDSQKYPEGSKFLREILDQEPLTAVELIDVAGGPRELDTVICRAQFSTAPSPSAENRVGPVWSAEHFVIQQLWKLHAAPAPVQTKRIPSAESPPRNGAEAPSGMSIALWLSAKNARRIRRINASNQELSWRLAIRKCPLPLYVNPSNDALNDFRWLPAMRGFSWADPRLFSHQSSNWVFFEQWRNGLTKGEIYCGILNDDGALQEVRPCLRKAYHLSYPQLFEEHGEIFLIPESEEAGGVDLFRARHFPDDWVLEKRLIDIPCVDPTPFRWGDRWWMVVSPQNVRGVAAISWLYSAPRLTGPWLIHPASPVAVSAIGARGGGPIFSHDSRLIRPSQDCGQSYGRALIFNEILALGEEGYEEKSIARVDPGWKPGLMGVHTYSRLAGWEVIDGAFTSEGDQALFLPLQTDGTLEGAVRKPNDLPAAEPAES